MNPHPPLTIPIEHLRAFQTCPRLYRLRHRDNHVPLGGMANTYHWLVRGALLAYWRTVLQNLRRLEGDRTLPDLAARMFLRGAQCRDEFERQRAIAALAAYHAVRGGILTMAPRSFTPLAVEVPVSLPVEDAGGQVIAYLTDTIDMLATDSDERLVVTIFRTTSENLADQSPVSPLLLRFRVDGEPAFALQAAGAAGGDASGVVFDMVGRPQQRPLEPNAKRSTRESAAQFGDRVASEIAADTNRYLRRFQVSRHEAQVDVHGPNLLRWVQQYVATVAADQYPMNGRGCQQFHVDCSFLPVCGGVAKLTDPTRYQQDPAAEPADADPLAAPVPPPDPTAANPGAPTSLTFQLPLTPP